MSKYVITVSGWLPENEYRYGGTPEWVNTYCVEARNAEEAKVLGRRRFEDERPAHLGCDHIETTEGS